MKRIYLNHELNENTPAYANAQNQIKIDEVRSLKKGDTSNNLHLSLPNHIGTHIDFPAHFCPKGKTFSHYDASFFVFDQVAMVTCDMYDLEMHLDSIDTNIEMLLVKTGFEGLRETEHYTLKQHEVFPEYAKVLREKFPHLRLFGFDMISVSSMLDREMGREAHRAFLCEENILLLEDMRLSGISPRDTINEVIVAPLALADGDGAPCTVIATIL
jgi:arylformamidase